MTNSTTEYMLEEYKQIANGYQDLHAQQNELVKSYLTLVAVPATILALAVQFVDVESLAPSDLQDVLIRVGLPILAALMVALTLVGWAVVAALAATRAEALLYVRTVNCIRRYFVEHDPEGKLKRYLVLPDFDTVPPYFEGLETRPFWNMMLVTFFNTGIAFATALTAAEIVQSGGSRNVAIALLAAAGWLIMQVLTHRTILRKHDKVYRVKFAAPFPLEKRIGVDLDGVLNDLAGEVIEVARVKYGLHIRREDIVSHRLDECTDLTAEQVKEIFESTDVFESSRPASGAAIALKSLRQGGWAVHILTDRFWSREDWTNTSRWLKRHNFEWDHLNLVRANEKALYAQAHGIEVFVEDNYETAMSLAEVCDKVYLLDRSYNRGELPKNVHRVDRWERITKDLLRNR